MWSAISRIFVKSKSEEGAATSPEQQEEYNVKGSAAPGANTNVHVFEAMDRKTSDDRRRGPGGDQQLGFDAEHYAETHDSRQVLQLFFNKN